MDRKASPHMWRGDSSVILGLKTLIQDLAFTMPKKKSEHTVGVENRQLHGSCGII